MNFDRLILEKKKPKLQGGERSRRSLMVTEGSKDKDPVGVMVLHTMVWAVVTISLKDYSSDIC